LRVSLVAKTAASALREVSYQQVVAELLKVWFWPRITHKAEGLVEN
jgi:hypothetical protein